MLGIRAPGIYHDLFSPKRLAEVMSITDQDFRCEVLVLVLGPERQPTERDGFGSAPGSGEFKLITRKRFPDNL